MNQHRYTLEELPKTFIGTGEVKGFSFTQIKQNEFAYIYQVNVEGKLHFEVFKKKSTPICIDFMNRIYSETGFREIYPKAKNFGINGWTYSTYQEAAIKFHKISNSIAGITNDCIR